MNHDAERLRRALTSPPEFCQRQPRRLSHGGGHQSKVLPDFACGGRFVKRNEMNSWSAFRQKLLTQFSCHLDADGANCYRVVGHGSQSPSQRCRKSSTRQFGERFNLFHAGHRHDTGDDGGIKPSCSRGITQTCPVLPVEKELGNGKVGSSSALLNEVASAGFPVGATRVFFGKCGHADAEVA